MYMTARRQEEGQHLMSGREGERLTLLGVDEVLSCGLGVGISLEVGRLVRSLDLSGLVLSAETGGEAPLVARDESGRADDGICESSDESAASEKKGKRVETYRR